MATTTYIAEGTKVSSISEMKEKCSPTDCLARMILGETGNQPKNEMIAVAYVAKNRLEFPRTFGSDLKEVLFQGEGSQFQGIKSAYALNPTSHPAWKTCLNVAKTYTQESNPIGHCLWFCQTQQYLDNLKANGGKYNFGSGSAKEVVYEICLGNAHYFFLVEGFDF